MHRPSLIQHLPIIHAFLGQQLVPTLDAVDIRGVVCDVGCVSSQVVNCGGHPSFKYARAPSLCGHLVGPSRRLPQLTETCNCCVQPLFASKIDRINDLAEEAESGDYPAAEEADVKHASDLDGFLSSPVGWVRSVAIVFCSLAPSIA